MNDIIKVNELTKIYGSTLAVDHISFDVKEGEVFGFLGPNGAGKTTTIRIMVGLTQPNSGTALINGRDVLKESVQVKKTIGLVPETSNLYGELTSLENLIYQAELFGVPKKERRTHATQLLEEFGLKEHQEKPFQALSRGLKRRLTIAAALIHNPKILFLDEPTTGLDVMSARGLRKLILDAKKKGLTIFLTTHYIPEAESLCDRIAMIVKGKIRVIDTPESIKAQVKETEILEIGLDRVTEDLKNKLLSTEGIEKILIAENRIRFHTKKLEQITSPIIKSLEQLGVKIQSINTLSPSLEDAFVKITGLDSELMKIDKPVKMGPD
ncbi:MAG: ATP-binding cassette domain-containing protein [Syntrophaceae bacterium]|nr:ATP-binding cassette domain-containing protein [Syntrophaceae bacterium]